LWLFQNASAFPALSLLLAETDKSRWYGLQDDKLRDRAITFLELKGSDVVKLKACLSTDLPVVIYEILQRRPARESKLSVADIDSFLTRISKCRLKDYQVNEFKTLYQKASSLDVKWLFKIILKKLNTRVHVEHILPLYHPRALEIFRHGSNMAQICRLVETNEIDNVEAVKVFKPIQSMLCEKFGTRIDNSWMKKQLFLEVKLDGERFQYHKEGEEVKWFSRNGYNFSYSFEPYLNASIMFKATVHSLILDGEMIAYDKTIERFLSKGESVDVKNLKNQPNLIPVYYVFDVLYLNGQNYMEMPYSQRIDILDQLFDDVPLKIMKVQPTRIRDIEHIQECLNIAFEKGEEGIVLKEATSTYVSAGRVGGWFKIKPEYINGVSQEVDVVIVGAFFEHANDTNSLIKRYMVGAVTKTEDGSWDVYAIGKVVHGLSVAEKTKIHDSLRPHFVKATGQSMVTFEGGRLHFGDRMPDVWCPPNVSIVLEVKASELVKMAEYYTEFTFRFPRIVFIRDDKLWHDCCTLDEFIEMGKNENNGQVTKFNKRRVGMDHIHSSITTKRATTISRVQLIQNALKKEEVITKVEQVDNVLEGKEFCVLGSTPEAPPMEQLKKIIKAHGGRITEFPRVCRSVTTYAIIIGKQTMQAKNYIKTEKWNVFSADWLATTMSDVPLESMPKLKPHHIILARDDLNVSVVAEATGVDAFVLTEELKTQIAVFDAEMADYDLDPKYTPTLSDHLELDAVLYEGRFNPCMFRAIAGFFSKKTATLNLMKSIFEYHYGTVLQEMNEVLQPGYEALIFVDKNLQEGIEELLNLKERKVVEYKWIIESCLAGKLIPLEHFLINKL